MPLHLHRASRTDALAAALADLLATPPAEVFSRDLVLVPERGTERWLSQRLAHRLGAGPTSRTGDGVCAAVDLRRPRSLVAELTGTADDDPWAPDALAWPLLEVLDASLDQAWARPLAVHLGHGLDGEEAELRRSRRYAVARRLAGLLASYAAQRPGLLAAWSRGDDVDGWDEVRALPADLAWQPPLWRALAGLVDAPTPAERHAATLDRLAAGPVEHLPARLSLFGHTRMPRTDLELLVALAAHHDLHLFWPHPSDDLWRRLDGLLDADGGRGAGPVARRDDATHLAAEHPLLATFGRDVRELQRSVRAAASSASVVPVEHVHEPSAPDRESLLGWLQADLRANAVRPQGRTFDPAGDTSVSVHACHGPARQVDVLREVLLGLLADDETLEPRDILVMCPDIETYAPLVTAAFGLGVDDEQPASPSPSSPETARRHPGHRLRVRLADRALSRTNPLLAVAASLLGLASGRTAASQVLDLLQQAPVRRRFGLDDDDLETVTTWVRESGVRWGLDQQRRAPYGLGALVQNTWRFGLDRVLAGVALSDDSRAWLGTTLPLDDVGSNRVDLAGRLAEYVDRLDAALVSLSDPQPLSAWVTALGDAVSSLTRPERGEAWQVGQVRRELAAVLADAGDRAGVELRLRDVRALLDDHLAGRPTRANFRTGTLTVATMVPMRSVPHRVVCLVGLDDGVFPRQGALDGDDVLARTPLTGERDPRSEDRQLLLDAIAAATETLVVTYTGADEHTGRRRPPAVPLGELLDALDRTTEDPVRERLVVEHPLQPYDPRSAADGGLGSPGPFTFDPAVLDAARVLTRPRPAPPAFLEQPLAVPAGAGGGRPGAGGDVAPADVALADLVGFFRDPVRGFFRALDLSLPWEAESVRDAMPVEIDGLETWGVGERMLRDLLRGTDRASALGAEWRRGALPPGRLGWRKANDTADQAELLARAALEHRGVEPRAHDVDVTLRDGRRVTGTVTGVHGDRVVDVTYSRLDGKHLAPAWVRLLALSSHDPDHSYRAIVIGRGPGRGHTRRVVQLGPPTEEPQSLLEDLVRLYDAGRREPLPLPVRTSYAWAGARHSGDDPVTAATRKWVSGTYPAEDADPAHVRVWGPRAPLSDLLGPPRPGEEADGEDTRLGALAARLWLPMLAREVPL